MNSFLQSALLIFLPVFLFFSCDTRQNIDREAIKKEMKSREIIRLTDNQVLMEAEKVGDLATADSTGIPEDILTTYLIETDTIRWDDTVTDSTFRAIKEVFQYAGESGIDPPKGIQASDEKAFFYCVPLSDSTGVTGVAVLTIPRKHIIINYSED